MNSIRVLGSIGFQKLVVASGEAAAGTFAAQDTVEMFAGDIELLGGDALGKLFLFSC